jgi:hypothetical protein
LQIWPIVFAYGPDTGIVRRKKKARNNTASKPRNPVGTKKANGHLVMGRGDQPYLEKVLKVPRQGGTVTLELTPAAQLLRDHSWMLTL